MVWDETFRVRALFHTQPAKKPQLHNPTFPLVDFGQRVERVVERDQIRSALRN